MTHSRINNILLDLDNTILDFNQAERHALARTLRKIGIEPTNQITSNYSDINLQHWKLLELGQISREELKVRRFSVFLDGLGSNASPEEAARTYESYLGQGHYFLEGAEELLANLYANYRLYLATNGIAHVQKGRIESAGIAPYFEEIFVSQLVGYNKPDVRFFDACFAKIPEFDRRETVIIGDSLSSDIQGGLNAGIHTIWFNLFGEENRSEIQPDHEVRHLDEIVPLLRSLFS